MKPSHWTPGIDVSHYQGKIDWSKVAAEGYRFAWIKATQGVTGTDAMFKTNVAGARAAGLKVGAYHFHSETSDPDAQVRHFRDVAGVWLPGDLPPVLDVEGTPAELKIKGEALVTRVAGMLASIERYMGRRPVVYTYTAFWRGPLVKTKALGAWRLWQAQYTTAAEPDHLDGWTDWTFWQHTAKGTVPGITGRCDLDYFKGDVKALDAFCGP